MQRFTPGCNGQSHAKNLVDPPNSSGGLAVGFPQEKAGRIKAVRWVDSRSDTVISLGIKSGPSKAPDQATSPKHDPAVKIAFYALCGTLGGTFLTALAQIAVAWIQRH